MTSPLPEVLTAVRGRAGRITLNRPKALNALTAGMVRLIDGALDRYEQDPAVTTVVIDALGDRAFCAGGDIRSIYDAMLAGDPAPRDFWADEYRLNARIARFRKPVVSLMDGIVMGGGVGLGAHARWRIVTERSAVAMPEVGIGFVPDVGGTWLLSRGRGELGTHLALTGGRAGAADAILAGLADYHVPSDRLAQVAKDLEEAPAAEVIPRFATTPVTGELGTARDWIGDAYAGDDIRAIVDRLEQHGGDAAAAAATIRANSPTAVAVALRSLRLAAADADLESSLEREFRVSSAFLAAPDFREGVRAAVIDKDRTPRWNPLSLSDITDTDVDRFFAPGADDLRLAPKELQR